MVKEIALGVNITADNITISVLLKSEVLRNSTAPTTKLTCRF
jgi:hypothetical protein